MLINYKELIAPYKFFCSNYFKEAIKQRFKKSPSFTPDRMGDIDIIKTKAVSANQRLRQILALGLPMIAARGLPLTNTDTEPHRVCHALTDGTIEFVIPSEQTAFGANHTVVNGELKIRYNGDDTLNISPEYQAGLENLSGKPHSGGNRYSTRLDALEIRAIQDKDSGLYFCFPWKKGKEIDLDSTYSIEAQTIDEKLALVKDDWGLPIRGELHTLLPSFMELGWYVSEILEGGSPVLNLPYDTSNPFVGKRDDVYGIFSKLGIDASKALAKSVQANDVEAVAKDFRTKRSGEVSQYVVDSKAVVQGVYNVQNGKLVCFPVPTKEMIRKYK